MTRNRPQSTWVGYGFVHFLVPGAQSGTTAYYVPKTVLCPGNTAVSRTSLALVGALLTWNKSSNLLWLQGWSKELPTPEPIGSSAKNKDSNTFPQGYR